MPIVDWISSVATGRVRVTKVIYAKISNVRNEGNCLRIDQYIMIL